LAELQKWGGRSALDLVFLDPPYDSSAYDKALALAAAALKPDGFIYLEARQAWSEPAINQAIGQGGASQSPGVAWRVVRHLKAGQVHAHLLQRAPIQAGA
jgi:16S rRNA G966 N2-methylase RsmD